MKFTDSVFKAYDIRGVVGTEITEGLALGIGRGFADVLTAEGPVAVGYDMRPDSVLLAQRLREGIIEQGREVWDIGLVTSDMIYFAVGHYGLAGGAMVTASHNPEGYNGIKLCREGAAPLGAETGLQDIKAAVTHDSYSASVRHGTVMQRVVIADWVTHVLSFVRTADWPSYRVAVDAGNGMAGAIIPQFEPHLPLQITELDFQLDGSFPHHPANPLEVENIRDEITKITTAHLDFGIAFDGDGDRAFLIDELGHELSSNVTLQILIDHYLTRYPGAVVLCDVRCSRAIEELVREKGGTLHRTKVGHSFIKAEMRKYQAVLAGELSGHFYFKDNFWADSGLIAALVAVDALAASKLKLSQLAKRYRQYFDSGELNFTVADKLAVIERLAGNFKEGSQDRLDGLTVSFDDWWFNIRPSNTEPLLRLNVEATTATVLHDQLQVIQAIIATP